MKRRFLRTKGGNTHGRDQRYERCNRAAYWLISGKNFFAATRSGTMKFERISVDGSEKMDTYMESIEPFDDFVMIPFDEASDLFAPKYITGAADPSEETIPEEAG